MAHFKDLPMQDPPPKIITTKYECNCGGLIIRSQNERLPHIERWSACNKCKSLYTWQDYVDGKIVGIIDPIIVPIRIQRKRTKGWKMPANTVYVGRGSEWGNPFVVGIDGDHAEVVRKFEKYFQPYTHAKGSIEDFYISVGRFEHAKNVLKGKNLACWCKESDICHADYLLKLVNDNSSDALNNTTGQQS